MDEHGLLFGERRMKERKTCSRLIEIDDDHRMYKAHLRNLTAQGAFFEPDTKIKLTVGQKISLTIPYGTKRSDLTIRAKVARVSDMGIGVRFFSADMF